MSTPMYPGVHVQLTGEDGNIFSIMGRTTAAMREAGLPETAIRPFVSDMFDCPSYADALGVVGRYVSTA